MKKMSFNEGWEVSSGGSSLMEAFRPGAGKKQSVQLPHDAMIHEKPVPEALSGAQTGFYPGGEYIYTKKFTAPKEWEGRSVIAEFEGVYEIARVYLNGNFVTSNLHGYGGFDAVLDRYLRTGEENEIKVIANNPDPNSRWYSGSGIYRNVNLLVGNEVHIVKDSVRITTREIGEAAVAEVETKVKNLTRKAHKMVLKTVWTLAASGEKAAEDSVIFTVFPEDTETLRQNILIENPKLWDCENPNLYDVQLVLCEAEEVMDEESVRTGLRMLALDGKRGLRINGKPVKQRGTCIHHDNGIIGAATFAAAERKRAREIKEAGFNAIRSAHHPMSPEMLAACDEYGLLVMDELTDMWHEQKNRNDFSNFFDRCWEEETEKMVKKDYNHPCVILYSSGNEILDLGRESGGAINRKICNRFHELDATRYTTTAVNGLIASAISGEIQGIIVDILKAKGIDPSALGGDGSSAESGVGAANMMMQMTNEDAFCTHPLMSEVLEEAAQAADIAGYNYLTGRHAMEKELHPNKPVLGTETYPADIVRLWRIVEENDNVLGDYTWTGYDYLGEAGCGIFYYDGKVNFSSNYPDRIAYIGDINILGYRRPISYLREIVFGLRKEPYIGVIRMNRYGQKISQTSWMFKDNVSSWTWPGFEGKETEVDIYSADEEAELFLNGKSLGKKPCGKDHDFTATWKVTYEPGELLAVSYQDGKETGRYLLTTAGEKVVLTAEADRKEIKAGGEDLSFVTVKLKDEKGCENLSASKTVTVRVEGPGVLQGFGSADPQPVRSYDDTTWETFDGEVMAAVRTTNETGTIRVIFSADGCEDAEVSIESR